MIVCHISDLDNPQLDPYRELKRTNLTRWSKWFIAEGKLVVERLLQSNYEVYSVLLSEKRLDSFGPKIPDEMKVLVVPDELCSSLVGFDFHTGIIACAVRPQKKSVGDLPDSIPEQQTFVVCPNTTLPDNLGSILRVAAAFSVNGVVIGPNTADPFSRRTVRVSMGNVLTLSIFEPTDLLLELQLLKERWGFEVVAANQSPQAIDLCGFQRPNRLALVLGNEASGIAAEVLEACDREIEIKIASAVDSLNVSTATAVLLYELTKNRR